MRKKTIVLTLDKFKRGELIRWKSDGGLGLILAVEKNNLLIYWFSSEDYPQGISYKYEEREYSYFDVIS